MAKRTLYFGPWNGFYTPSRFDAFVKKEVAARISQLGLVNTCNLEEGEKTTLYHFPGAGISL